MPSERPRVALFVTCLVDLHRPTIGFAAIRLLEQAGCQVEVPRAQTCCGQPAYNSGDRATTRDLAEGHPRCVRRLRLRGGAVRFVRRHAEASPAAPVRRRPQPARARRRSCRTNFRAGQLPRRCHGCRAPADAACRRPGHVSRQLLRPARTRHQGAAATAAAGDRCQRHRDGGCRSLLRIWRHFLREVPRHLRPHGVRQGSRHRRHRSRDGACRRPGLPAEHRRPTAARRPPHQSHGTSRKCSPG